MFYKFLIPFLILLNAHGNESAKLLSACKDKRYVASQVVMMIKNNRHLDLEIKDEKYKATPLIWCTINGLWKMADVLLQNGAEPNALDIDKQSALMIAAKNGQVKIVNSLLGTGAIKTFKDRWGYSAADWANRGGHYKIVVMIGEKPDNLIPYNKREIKKAYYLLNEVYKNSYPLDAFKKRFKGFGYLIDEPFINGNTLLQYAAYEGKVALLKVCLDLEANPNTRNKLGNTALMMAASAGNIKALRLLIYRGADPYTKNKEGKSALDFAEGNIEVAIIEFTKRKTAKNRAVQNQIIENLREYKSPTKLALLVKKHMKDIQKMAKRDKTRKQREEAALRAIVENDVEDLAEIPWPGPKASQGRSPYMSWAAFNAVWSNNYRVLKQVLNRGLNINLRDVKGNTLLHLAAEKGNQAFVDLLITEGAAFNVTNKAGSTPLMLAARSNQVRVVFYLLQAGANKRIRNKRGWTASRFAQQARNRRTFNALKF